MKRPEHLTAGELAGYLDRNLAPDRFAQVEGHLDACAECRTELAAIARLADSYQPGETVGRIGPSRPIRRWAPLAIAGALAAGLAALILIRPEMLDRSHRGEPLRAPNFGEARATIEIVSPLPDSVVPREPLSLIWRPASATLYKVTIVTEAGDSVWAGETTDTALALPADLTLLPGRNYFWRVDGIGNGIVASTPSIRLRVAP